ncbi:hypothetical protein L596_030706 [Steinernema carpocapsae]|uniref:Uncharacterized protein n=1 Tax=Steinernema carpocapsae TaxID=34508 RepID=A0A4U5LNI6_STECR|nr:hypothetical protein L596_030706 [Steinernema carpocapsae]
MSMSSECPNLYADYTTCICWQQRQPGKPPGNPISYAKPNPKLLGNTIQNQTRSGKNTLVKDIAYKNTNEISEIGQKCTLGYLIRIRTRKPDPKTNPETRSENPTRSISDLQAFDEMPVNKIMLLK